MALTEEAFFTRDGAQLIPNAPAAGPWTPDTLHGRVIVGVLGAEIERVHGDADFMPARLTVDLYRAPKLRPLEVVTRVVREGPRIKLIDAELISEGRAVGRASCQLLRRVGAPEGVMWTGETWSVPPPEAIAPASARATMNGLWELRQICGDFGELGQRRAWMREVRPLVAGEALTPFRRVVAGADFASPLANSAGAGLTYINTDLTLYLHREPVGEWIGYETIAHGSTDGVGVGHCNLYDLEGRIGFASSCALFQAMQRKPG